MRDPFKIEGPAIISFSGGRTSAYMLWHILQSWGGTLPEDVKVCFANTGKEMPETLDFIEKCGERWSVEINWLEYNGRWLVTDYAHASRYGEPFAAMITKKSMLPNPVMRFCTQELKIKPIEQFAKSSGWEEWANVLGLRADEPRRLAKRRENVVAPLAAAGITKRDIVGFWANQDFDLALPTMNGTTPMGNCDGCFLKGASSLMGIERQRPGTLQWWADQETNRGATFRSDRPSYSQMIAAVRNQRDFDFGDLDQRIDCMCSEDAA